MSGTHLPLCSTNDLHDFIGLHAHSRVHICNPEEYAIYVMDDPTNRFHLVHFSFLAI